MVGTRVLAATTASAGLTPARSGEFLLRSTYVIRILFLGHDIFLPRSRYADDLANRAERGFVQYQRQALVGGSYGLTDTKQIHPQSALGPTEPLLLRPGYWVNFLWKRTLGTSVYNLTSSSASVRAYMFSGAPPSTFAANECTSSEAQLLLINLSEDANATVALPKLSARSYYTWTLAPARGADGSLASYAKDVELNGKRRPDTVDASDGSANFLERLPQPAKGSVSEGAVLAPLSVSFLCA